jgi:hypothetical protein
MNVSAAVYDPNQGGLLEGLAAMVGWLVRQSTLGY